MPKLELIEQYSPNDGTRKQWESDWTFIEDTGTHEFTHDLGEIPWVVDIIQSTVSDGANPTSSSATATKTTATITVTNGTGADAYFQVRAL